MAVDMKQFAPALLKMLNAPVTHANVAALVGWQAAEGGAVHNNPFNTTEGAPGATTFNSVGVKSYTNPQEALHATYETLTNGLYAPIIGALRNSNPNAFVQAVGSSQWGTSGETLSTTVHDALGQNFGLTPAERSGAKQVAQSKTIVKTGKPTHITAPGTTNTVTAGGETNYRAAVGNALLNSFQPINTSGALPSTSPLLSNILANIGSGAYATPVTATTSTTPSETTTIPGAKTIAQGKAKGAQHANAATTNSVLNPNGTPINPNGKVVDLHFKGIVNPKAPWNPSGKPVAAWIVPMLQYAWNHGARFEVNSGYRSDAEQTAIYDSGVRPAAVPKSLGGSGSNHEGNQFPAGAVDLSNAAAVSAVLENSPYKNLLVYAGAKDPVHFSHPHDGSY